jgi:hypothetical protein
MKMDLSLGIVTDVMLKQLPFIQGKYRYVSLGRDDKPKADTWMYSVEEDSVEKISALLKGGALPSLAPKSRGYVVPGCKYSVAQLRDIAKISGFTITNDPLKADFFISHNKVKSTGNQNQQVPDNLICAAVDCQTYVLANDFSRARLTAYKSRFEFVGDDEKVVLFSRRYYTHYDSWSSLHGTEIQYNLLPARTVEIIYQILAKKVPVVDEDLIFDSIERLVIDEDMFNGLHSMLNSGSDDKRVAAEMVYNCNYSASMYYIYRLFEDHYYDIQNNMTTTNWKVFSSKIDASKVKHLDFPSDIKYFYDMGYLTEDNYDRMVNDRLHDLNARLDRTDQKFFRIEAFCIKTYTEYLRDRNPITETKPEAPLPF